MGGNIKKQQQTIYGYYDNVHLTGRESISVGEAGVMKMSCHCDKLVSHYCAFQTRRVITLPGIQILRPRLQNVWETDREVPKCYYGISPDHRESRALQDCKHQSDVFFTH